MVNSQTTQFSIFMLHNIIPTLHMDHINILAEISNRALALCYNHGDYIEA